VTASNHCIICREETTDFSDEHVIPEALGGYYHIYSVCRSCNSKLGSSVDSKLVNHQFADFQRYLLGLKGKSNKLPNPFSGTHHLAEDETKKVQLRLDENNKPIPYTITSVCYEKSVSEIGSTKVSILLDASDGKKLDGILHKIAKKLQVPIEQFEGIDRSIKTTQSPYIKCTLSIDLSNFKIGLLKIAYEFAVDTVDAFFSDPSAIEISGILSAAKYGSVDEYVTIGSGFDHTLFDSMKDYFDLESKKHYLVLIGSKSDGLCCLIHLHGMFSIGVQLSNLPYPDNLAVFGVNVINGRSFRKVYPDELIKELYSAPELRFQYYFSTESSLREFLELQSADGFGFFVTENGHPIFDHAGNCLNLNLHEKMKSVESLVESEALEDGGIAHTFPFQEEVFIKITPSGRLVQVIAVREELKQVSKL